MKSMDEFLARILPRVPGVPRPMVHDAIRQAAIEFCQRTRMWRDEDEFRVSGECEPMVAIGPAAIFEIESARFNGNQLRPVSLAWLDEQVPRWRDMDASEGRWITQLSPDTVKVVPGGDGLLTLSLVLQPSDKAVEVPDFLVTHYVREIADGALGELFATPGQWANPGLAEFHLSRFQRRLDELFNSNMKGQQGAPVRTKPHFF